MFPDLYGSAFPIRIRIRIADTNPGQTNQWRSMRVRIRIHPVLRIRDVYPGSDFFPSRIRTVSIQDPGSASKNLSILTQKKWFLSSRKYDPGCSSRIPDPDADFYPSRIQGSKRHRIPDPGSRIRIRNTAQITSPSTVAPDIPYKPSLKAIQDRVQKKFLLQQYRTVRYYWRYRYRIDQIVYPKTSDP
jgi:hypothetical protein